MCELEIPEDIGKRFAKVTGDYNPIHISPLMARLFGLKRNIIHAMWFCGFIGSKLFHLNKINPIQIDLAFRSPIFVGSKATVISEARDKNLRFDTYCQGNSKVCINGFIGEFTDER
jgi:acyl dehydratase